MPDYTAHPTALVQSSDIGPRTRIWANVHIMAGVVIGPDCNICDGSFIESGAVLGRGVTVKTHVDICEAVTIEDAVFIGPGTLFTNDLRPRSPRLGFMHDRYSDKSNWLLPTRVGTGATLCAGAIILCGLTVGAWSLVSAGAVVTRDVQPFTYVTGNPARPFGHVCACCEPIVFEDGRSTCQKCGRHYAVSSGLVTPTEPIELWNPGTERKG